jgi:hypothetical protein
MIFAAPNNARGATFICRLNLGSHSNGKADGTEEKWAGMPFFSQKHNLSISFFNPSSCATPLLVSWIGGEPSIHYGGVPADVKPYSSKTPLEPDKNSREGGVWLCRGL